MRIAAVILAGCMLVFGYYLLIYGNTFKTQKELTRTDSIMNYVKAGYFMGADRERLHYDANNTWVEDSTLFYNHFLKTTK